MDRENPEFKAPWNQIRNIPRVFTPEDKAIQTPNSDTPYSMLGLDLRAESFVLTVLYVAQTSADANAILASNTRKDLVLQFLRDVGGADLSKGWQEGFDNNAKAELPRSRSGSRSSRAGWQI